MARIRDSQALAYHLFRQSQPAVKRTEPTAADIQRESRQIYYGQLIHDGMDEEQAYQATVEHFAINDHRAIGAIREEE